MRFNLVITFADGTKKEITASTPDLVAFEDKFNVSVGSLASSQRLGSGTEPLVRLRSAVWVWIATEIENHLAGIEQ